MKHMRWMICTVLACLLVLFALPVVAQSDTPQANAEQIRQKLFTAQSKLMLGDNDAALKAMDAAYDRYQTSLQPIFSKAVPDVAASIDKGFQQAKDALQKGEGLTLAIARGGIWTDFLNASAQLAIQAVKANDGKGAAQWLLLREFTASTKFSRPNADATKAVQAFIAGTGKAESAIEAIHNDLLDTYQAQMTSSLASADDAHQTGFSLREAEEIGLAAGYFDILANTYAEQRGEASLKQTQLVFNALEKVAVSGDKYGYDLNMQTVQTALKGFRAAPLSETDQARRAGQLIRFVDLVSIEYSRGVRDGVVTKDIEIQEATTFLEASTAAFNDISITLEKQDVTKTNRVADLLSQMKTQIQTVANPTALQANVTEIQKLLKDVVPAQWQQVASTSDMDVITSVLDQIPVAVKSNQYDLAESARLEAYGFLELGMEQRLRGFAPEMAAQIEGLFWQGTDASSNSPAIPGLATLIASRASLDEIKATIATLKTTFTQAQQIMDAGKSTPTIVVSNSAIIVFREGLEAVLILASLLASLRTLEERQFRRPIIIGAVLAFVATGLTWWAANALLQTMLPLGERLEAIVSLIAIGVLLLITNWFFHKVYWTGWMAGFHSKKRDLVGGVAVITLSQTLGLVILGFTSIYREGFESVLFMQSLVLEAGLGVVLQGVALGLVGVAIVGVITFTLQRKLPYKKMLVVTGVMIGFVLLTMVGNTVHVMQVVGWMPITPIAGLTLPLWIGQWFGVFATWQGIGLQIVAAVFVIGSYFWAEYMNKNRRESKTTSHKEQAVASSVESHA